MSLEQQLATLQQDVGNHIAAVDTLTQEVVGKMAAIDQRVTDLLNQSIHITPEGAVQTPNQPRLLSGPLGGWQSTAVYPDTVWTAVPAFENVVENVGGFSFSADKRTCIVPQDGRYLIKGQLYSNNMNYHHTQIHINGRDSSQGLSTHTYTGIYGSGAYLEVWWDQVIRLKKGDSVKFIVYPSGVKNTALVFCHGYATFSLDLLG